MLVFAGSEFGVTTEQRGKEKTRNSQKGNVKA